MTPRLPSPGSASAGTSAPPAVLVLLGVVACSLGAALLPARPAAAAPPRVARDQLFFASAQPEPLLAVLIVQRSAVAGGGARLETKVFLAHRGRWRPPFWERFELKAWPGPSLVDAVRAWRRAGGGRRLRLSVDEEGGGISVRVRSKQGGLSLIALRLRSAGSGPDPHGEVRWRAGHATMRLNGRTFDGVIVHERLRRPKTAWPRFGRFEMWLYGPPGGGLLLGRAHRKGARGQGRALDVSRAARALIRPFDLRVVGTRRDAEGGFDLPVRWRVGPKLVLRRRDGVLAHGEAPGGGKAAYDVSLAVATGAESPGAMALVFHLQDDRAGLP